MAALEKVFKCITCGQEIKLERKPDNTGWNKFDLDGTKHIDERKNKKQAVDNGPQLVELTKQVSDLKETVNILISQIQMLRSDVRNKKQRF